MTEKDPFNSGKYFFIKETTVSDFFIGDNEVLLKTRTPKYELK